MKVKTKINLKEINESYQDYLNGKKDSFFGNYELIKHLLVRGLKAKYNKIDITRIEDAVSEALIKALNKDVNFDISKGNIINLLYIISKNNLIYDINQNKRSVSFGVVKDNSSDDDGHLSLVDKLNDKDGGCLGVNVYDYDYGMEEDEVNDIKKEIINSIINDYLNKKSKHKEIMVLYFANKSYNEIMAKAELKIKSFDTLKAIIFFEKQRIREWIFNNKRVKSLCNQVGFKI